MRTRRLLHIPRHWLLPVLLLLTPHLALAQQTANFGRFELHYSVVNTTFLDPKIATNYGITRGKNRAILNLALREKVGDSSAPRAMTIQGRSSDLIHKQDLVFREIREEASVYYIAEFTFINEEWRVFDIDFRPEGADTSHTFKFKHQLYSD